MNPSVSKEHTISYSSTSLKNEQNTFYDCSIEEKNCYEKTDNFVAQQTNKTVCEEQGYECEDKGNNIAQIVDHNYNESNLCHQANDQPGNAYEDCLQAIDEDSDNKDYLQINVEGDEDMNFQQLIANESNDLQATGEKPSKHNIVSVLI